MKSIRGLQTLAILAVLAYPVQAGAQSLTRTYLVRSTGHVDFTVSKPKPLPEASPAAATQPTTGFVYHGAPTIMPGAVGSGITRPVRIAPAASGPGSQSPASNPSDYGATQLPFDTFRVDGFGATDTTNYPYRAAGRLDYNEVGGGFYCSASLIKKGIVVTAAHCVAEYGTNTYYNDWVFTPAYSDGDAPYGVWTAKSATALTSYLNGTDSCSQPGVVCQDDVAVLTLNPDSSGALPGTATGWFAVGINGYSFAARKTTVLVTQLGYPAALDGGEKMQRNDAQGTVDGSYANNTLIGSLMSGGSSGGPWVVNWGAAPNNLGKFGNASVRDVVVGVTSWGASNKTYLRQGAAPFTSDNISALVDAACAASPGNC